MASIISASEPLTRPDRPVVKVFGARPKRPLIAGLAALATLGSGLINLYSLTGPDLPERFRILREVFPLEFLHLSRFITLVLGFSLIISSVNVYKRKKRALQTVVLLSALSIVFHMTKGLDYEEALCSLALLIGLLLARKHFTVRSSIPEWRSEMLRLGLAVLAAVGYGVAGFWLLERHEFGINFNWREAIHQTFLYLTFIGDPTLVPHTRFARWFLDSLYVMTLTAIGYVGLALFRPALYQFRILPHERMLAGELIHRYSRTAGDYFKTWSDKSFFFSPSRECVLAYGVAAHFALVLGDPVGRQDELEEIIHDFSSVCIENDWGVAFYQTLPDFLPLYTRQGFRKLKIGDDAIVDLTRFSLDGKARKDVRSKTNQLEKQGVYTIYYEPPVPDEVLAEVQEVSDEWLQIPGRKERQFTLGYFEPQYVQSTPLFAVREKEGRLLAFANILPSFNHGESAIDLMRRRTEAPNGVMDYLFAKLFVHLKEQGFERFNLGMAPMSGFQEEEESTPEEKAIHFFFQHLNFLFSYQGIYHFKAKFATDWEPRYVVYRRVFDLPRVATALSKLSDPQL